MNYVEISNHRRKPRVVEQLIHGYLQDDQCAGTSQDSSVTRAIRADLH